MNQIAEDQNKDVFQRLMRARSRVYTEAVRLQIAQFVSTVVLPMLGALIAMCSAASRPYVALAALIVTEPVTALPHVLAFGAQVAVYQRKDLSGLQRWAEAVQKHGTYIVAQLQEPGRGTNGGHVSAGRRRAQGRQGLVLHRPGAQRR